MEKQRSKKIHTIVKVLPDKAKQTYTKGLYITPDGIVYAKHKDGYKVYTPSSVDENGRLNLFIYEGEEIIRKNCQPIVLLAEAFLPNDDPEYNNALLRINRAKQDSLANLKWFHAQKGKYGPMLYDSCERCGSPFSTNRDKMGICYACRKNKKIKNTLKEKRNEKRAQVDQKILELRKIERKIKDRMTPRELAFWQMYKKNASCTEASSMLGISYQRGYQIISSVNRKYEDFVNGKNYHKRRTKAEEESKFQKEEQLQKAFDSTALKLYKNLDVEIPFEVYKEILVTAQKAKVYKPHLCAKRIANKIAKEHLENYNIKRLVREEKTS